MVEQILTKPDENSAPPRSKLTITLLSIIILVVTFGIVWLQSAKYEPLTVGKEGPDFSLPNLDETTVRLSDYRGKVVFLNFWATWCKPCREEMPSMEVLYRNFERDGLVVLAISIDRVTTKKDIPPFIKSLNLTFPVLVDSWGRPINAISSWAFRKHTSSISKASCVRKSSVHETGPCWTICRPLRDC